MVTKPLFFSPRFLALTRCLKQDTGLLVTHNALRRTVALADDGIETLAEWVTVSGLLQSDNYAALKNSACQLRSSLGLAMQSLQ
ncbi:hypothetical protein N7508_008558 [Penicillium antarcticum]|uniref:uncharacterized protein n=1 Tax=Penicillium antarcticum TaxID=416450 RepID=UPI00239DE6CE|nr:uncharacterized protein N7508_008558 [Penicillium antarcticum]KAJ5293737.1 hypothetical protein N7508_008558 [Penicillium antarcticum]